MKNQEKEIQFRRKDNRKDPKEKKDKKAIVKEALDQIDEQSQMRRL